MEIINVISDKWSVAYKALSELVDHYNHLNDTHRLEKSTTTMDHINTYLQIKENLVFPFIRKTNEHEDLVERAETLHSPIKDLIQHSIMMHVDEPDGEYLHDMVHLKGLWERTKKIDEEAIFPWLESYLQPNEEKSILSQLKTQTRHESVAGNMVKYSS